MKFAGHTMGLPDKNIFQCMDLLANAGYDGIEVRVAADGQINDLTYTPEFGRKVREYAATKRLGICCLTPYYKDFLNPEKRNVEIAGLKRVVDIAAELGCPLVRAFGGPAISKDADVEAARERIASGLREVAEYAQGKCVAIAIETHIGSGTYSATETADMLRRVNHPNVGVLLDYSWVFRGGPETVAEVFDLLGKRILHCHVKDYVGPHREGDFNLPQIVGEGCLPWPTVFEQLRRIGYRGFLCDEYEKYWKKELPEPEEWFPRNLAAMRRMVSTRRSVSA